MQSRIYYYHDLVNDDFANTNIDTKETPSNYKYVNKNVFYIIGETIIRIIVFPIIWLILKISYLLRIKNKKVLKEAKKSGYFIYGNHTNYLLDAYAPTLISPLRKTHIIVNPDATSIKGIRTLVKMLGAYPIPSTREGYKNYRKGINELISKKHVIAIYPEAHIWPYYTDIRPFGKESFHYPVECNVPSFTFTNIYVKRKIGKKPKVVTYVDGPFYPDELLPKAERIIKLRNEIYDAMKDRVDSNPKYSINEYIYVSDSKDSNAKNRII